MSDQFGKPNSWFSHAQSDLGLHRVHEAHIKEYKHYHECLKVGIFYKTL